MFDIEYKGANSVVISTKKVSIITDPKLSLVGLKDLNVKDTVELSTEERFKLNSDDARLVVEGPGEYGVADIDIKGISAQRHLDSESDPKLSTIYRVSIGDVSLGIIGNIFEKLSEDQLEELGVIDILILPVGGNGYTLDGEGAASVVRAVDPKVVIPVHYKDSGLNYEVPQDGLDIFTKALGATVEDVSGKYKIKSASSIPLALTVIKLARN